MCFQFQRGECDRGDACRFSHDTSGASAPPRGGGGDRPRGVCYSFQRGECTRGDGCRFSHEVSA
ncbi:hypothetical protein EON65_31730 [archaeon]|nr:MAG: hypothetical protein EON65_31730 [archaeon]